MAAEEISALGTDVIGVKSFQPATHIVNDMSRQVLLPWQENAA